MRYVPVLLIAVSHPFALTVPTKFPGLVTESQMPLGGTVICDAVPAGAGVTGIAVVTGIAGAATVFVGTGAEKF
jgi:hypothetical protein